MFSQECPKSVETVRNKMLTVLSKLNGLCFSLYLEWFLIHSMSQVLVVVKALLR